MKTTKLISKAILAACLCLGMAACGDDDGNGNNPGGGSGGSGFDLNVEQSDGGNRIADEGPNSKWKMLKVEVINWTSDAYSNNYTYSYDDQGRPSSFNSNYFSYPKDGKTIEVQYVFGLWYTFHLNSDELVESCAIYDRDKNQIGKFAFEYDSNRQLVSSTVEDYRTGDTSQTDITWQDECIAKIDRTETEDGVTSTLTITYEYSYDPSWKGFMPMDYLPTLVAGLANTTGYFGKRPALLIQREKRVENGETYNILYRNNTIGNKESASPIEILDEDNPKRLHKKCVIYRE